MPGSTDVLDAPSAVAPAVAPSRPGLLARLRALPTWALVSSVAAVVVVAYLLHGLLTSGAPTTAPRPQPATVPAPPPPSPKAVTAPGDPRTITPTDTPLLALPFAAQEVNQVGDAAWRFLLCYGSHPETEAPVDWGKRCRPYATVGLEQTLAVSRPGVAKTIAFSNQITLTVLADNSAQASATVIGGGAGDLTITLARQGNGWRVSAIGPAPVSN